MVAVAALEVPEGEPGVHLGVWDSPEGGVVSEAAVKHLVNH